MALEDKRAMEGYLETMMQGTTLKQKAYGTLILSEMHVETIEQLASLPWRAVVLRGRNENKTEDTRNDSNTLCKNTEVITLSYN